MSPRRAFATTLALLALTGCGEERPATTSRPATVPPPAGPSLSTARYAAALERYCATTADAVERLVATRVDERDPVAPIAALAERFRAGLERLGTQTPPVALRSFHLLTVAQGRESARRIDAGVRFGRRGDTDAATSALGELGGLLPGRLPVAVRGAAPSCRG